MQFLDEDIYEAVKNYLPKISEYVNSHSGCSMSLTTTKMLVQKKLCKLIHPALNVVNVDGTPENEMPEDVYRENTERVDNNDEADEEKQ